MKRYIFLLSSERSGSTLLQNMLNEHPQICAPPELWMLAFNTVEEWYEKKPQAIHSMRVLYEQCKQPFDKDNFLETNKDIFPIDIYNNLKLNGNVLVDKTPGYANDINTLKNTIELRPHYIWLVRHPLGVVNSKIKTVLKQCKASNLKKYYLYLGDELLHNTFKKRLSIKARKREDKWINQNINVGLFLNAISPIDKTLIFFEDLIQNPQREVSKICNDIKIHFYEKMTSPSFNQIPIKSGLGDQNINYYHFINPQKSSEWEKRYSETQANKTSISFYQSLKSLKL